MFIFAALYITRWVYSRDFRSSNTNSLKKILNLPCKKYSLSFLLAYKKKTEQKSFLWKHINCLLCKRKIKIHFRKNILRFSKRKFFYNFFFRIYWIMKDFHEIHKKNKRSRNVFYWLFSKKKKRRMMIDIHVCLFFVIFSDKLLFIEISLFSFLKYSWLIITLCISLKDRNVLKIVYLNIKRNITRIICISHTFDLFLPW